MRQAAIAGGRRASMVKRQALEKTEDVKREDVDGQM
jgi:hypothetical protein